MAYKATPAEQPVDTPPGPILLEIRINNRLALAQRVYSYGIDQRPDSIHIHGNLRPTDVEPE